MPRYHTYENVDKRLNPKYARDLRKTKSHRKYKYTLALMTLNEIEGLKYNWRSIPYNMIDEIIAVDGGSTDGTLEFYKKNKIRVIKQTSRGRGDAFRLAVKNAKHDYLIFFSPDGNEDPLDIPRFIPFCELGADVVIASRMMRGAINEEDTDIFRWRKWANKTFTLLANIFWKKRKQKYVTDTINGFRAIKKDVFNELNLDGAGYTIEYQMSIRAMKLGKEIAELPTAEGPRIGGKSGAKSIPTGFAFLGLLFKELFGGKKFAKK